MTQPDLRLLVPLVICILSKGVLTAPTDEGFEQLQSEVSLLKSEVEELTKTVNSMQSQLTTNIADQYADKTVQYIQSNNRKEAAMFWTEMLNHAKQSNQTEELMAKVIMNAYAGQRSNFYPVLEFILTNNIISAFPLLYKELESNGHIFDGQEIFILAQYIKDTCGTNTQLYQSLPSVVHKIISGPVIFRNTDNKGYIIATQHRPCIDRNDCYASPKSEVFIYKFRSAVTASEVIKNPRSHWQFVKPSNMSGMTDGFNGTIMSSGFHIKSISEDSFLVVKMRLITYFLRENTTFDPYYAGDLQCQFMPMLIENHEGSIKIGTKDKYVKRIEFVHGDKFPKKTEKTQIGRRNHNDLEGKVWEVISVKDDSMMMSEEMENTLDVDDLNNSKCQF